MKDHTNVITPEVSIITNVGIDHVKTLGGTKELIARQKAGIIKQGRPAVIGSDLPLDVIKEYLAEINHNSTLTIVPPDDNNFTFDQYNSKIARSVLCSYIIYIYRVALERIMYKFKRLNEENIREGIKAKQPSRMELVPLELLKKFNLTKYPVAMYLDVGHNTHAFVYINIYIYLETSIQRNK